MDGRKISSVSNFGAFPQNKCSFIQEAESYFLAHINVYKWDNQIRIICMFIIFYEMNYGFNNILCVNIGKVQSNSMYIDKHTGMNPKIMGHQFRVDIIKLLYVETFISKCSKQTLYSNTWGAFQTVEVDKSL